MAAFQALKRVGEVVFVESSNKGTPGSDWEQLPVIIKDAIGQHQGRYIPYIVIASPDLSKVFGCWGYEELKYKDFDGCFREAKKVIRQDKKDGKLAISGLEDTVEIDLAEAATTDNNIVTIENPSLKLWESAKGSTIMGKLIRVEHDVVFVFENANGKTIRVTAEQLSPDSLKKAKKQAEDTVNSTSAALDSVFDF